MKHSGLWRYYILTCLLSLGLLPSFGFQAAAPAEAKPEPTLADIVATANHYELKRIEFYRNMPWDGIRVRGLYEETPDGNLIVYMIMPDSPGEKAGILPEDVILSMNGKPVNEFNSSSLFNFMKSLKIGDELIYVIERQGKQLTIPVTLTAPTEAVMTEWMLKYRQKKKMKDMPEADNHKKQG